MTKLFKKINKMENSISEKTFIQINCLKQGMFTVYWWEQRGVEYSGDRTDEQTMIIEVVVRT